MGSWMQKSSWIVIRKSPCSPALSSVSVLLFLCHCFCRCLSVIQFWLIFLISTFRFLFLGKFGFVLFFSQFFFFLHVFPGLSALLFLFLLSAFFLIWILNGNKHCPMTALLCWVFFYFHCHVLSIINNSNGNNFWKRVKGISSAQDALQWYVLSKQYNHTKATVSTGQGT